MLPNSAILPTSDFSGFYWQFSGAISGDKIRLLCADLPEYYLTSKSNIQRGTLKTANSAIYKRFFYFRTYQGGIFTFLQRFPAFSIRFEVYLNLPPSFTLSELVTDFDGISLFSYFPTFHYYKKMQF